MSRVVEIDEAIEAALLSAESSAHERDRRKPFPSRNFHKRKFAAAMAELTALRAARARGETHVTVEDE
jgi:hypothetical protein